MTPSRHVRQRLASLLRPLEIIAAILYLPALALHLAGLSGAWAIADTALWSTVWVLFAAELSIGIGLAHDRRAWLRSHLVLVAVVCFGFPALPAIFELVPILELASVAGLFEAVDLVKLSNTVGVLTHHHRAVAREVAQHPGGAARGPEAAARESDAQGAARSAEASPETAARASRRGRGWLGWILTVVLVVVCTVLAFGALAALVKPHAAGGPRAGAATHAVHVMESLLHAPSRVQDLLLLAVSLAFAIVVVEVVPRRQAKRAATAKVTATPNTAATPKAGVTQAISATKATGTSPATQSGTSAAPPADPG